MTSTITIQKTIPESNWYTGSGDTTITLTSEDITVNCKKTLIKTPIPSSSSRQETHASDIAQGYVIDLKRVEDTITIRATLADDATQTAWNKAWKLRAMCSSGSSGGDKGALTNLTIDNIQFKSATQRAFLESVTINTKPSGITSPLNISAGPGIVRLDVNLVFYVGDPK
jgi:hypothetical protein